MPLMCERHGKMKCQTLS